MVHEVLGFISEEPVVTVSPHVYFFFCFVNTSHFNDFLLNLTPSLCCGIDLDLFSVVTGSRVECGGSVVGPTVPRSTTSQLRIMDQSCHSSATILRIPSRLLLFRLRCVSVFLLSKILFQLLQVLQASRKYMEVTLYSLHVSVQLCMLVLRY